MLSRPTTSTSGTFTSSSIGLPRRILVGPTPRPWCCNWRPRKDSNPRHTVPETVALSPELRGRGSEDAATIPTRRRTIPTGERVRGQWRWRRPTCRPAGSGHRARAGRRRRRGCRARSARGSGSRNRCTSRGRRAAPRAGRSARRAGPARPARGGSSRSGVGVRPSGSVAERGPDLVERQAHPLGAADERDPPQGVAGYWRWLPAVAGCAAR